MGGVRGRATAIVVAARPRPGAADCGTMPAESAMTRLSYPHRFVALVSLSSLSLLVLCASVAVFLYRMQSDTADVLGEDIGSRQAASDLNDSISKLADRLRQGSGDVAALHEQIAKDLTAITFFANKPEEEELAVKLRASFERYRAILKV